jgi:hypothetical protein
MKANAISKADILPAPKRRKRLFISKENIVKLRLAVEREPLSALWRRFLDDTTARLGTVIMPLPTDDADSACQVASYHSVFGTCLRDLSDSSFAFLITRKPGFATLARERIRTILSWRTWVHPANYPKTIDLITSEISRTLALACEWLGADLPINEREAVSRAVEDRVIEQYITGILDETGWWARECTTNWCAVVNGGIGSALLYFLDDNAILSDILNEIISRLSIYLTGFDPDGGWIEGITYWAYGITWYLYFADALANATQGKVNPAKAPQMKNAGFFPLYLYLPPNGMVNFCDAYPKASIGTAIPLLKLSREFNDPSFRRLASRIIAVSEEPPTPFLFIWHISEGEENALKKHPTGKIFRKIEWATIRSSWDDDAVILAAKAGYADPYEHTHLDAGTFLLSAFGTPLITEIGKGEYSRGYFSPKRWQSTYANTFGHNTFILDGNSQLSGREHKGVITDSGKSRNHKYIRMDITSCYPAEKAKLIIRHFILIDCFGCVILDEVQCPEGTRVESRFHYAGAGKIIGDAEFNIQNGNVLLSVRTALRIPSKIIQCAHGEPDIASSGGKRYFAETFYAVNGTILAAKCMFPYKLGAIMPVTALLTAESERTISVLINIGNHSQTLTWIKKNEKNVLDSIS